MARITLKGREIPLIYTVWEMKQIIEEIGPIGDVLYKATGYNPDDETDLSRFGSEEHLETVAKLAVILGNAGLEEAGQKPDLTEKKVLRSLKPEELLPVANECLNCLTEGMRSEIPDEKKEGPVDVTLEGINKKKVKEN